MFTRNLVVAAMLTVLGFGLPACNKSPDKTVADGGDAKTTKHDEWWCAEHGVPEEECGQCHTKVAADCKAKGDWCKQHDRPDSQCFICHPELKAKFALKYEAKYGKQPPEPTEGGENKAEEKKN